MTEKNAVKSYQGIGFARRWPCLYHNLNEQTVADIHGNQYAAHIEVLCVLAAGWNVLREA